MIETPHSYPRKRVNVLEEVVGKVCTNEELSLTLWESIVDLTNGAKGLVTHEEFKEIITAMIETVAKLAKSVDANTEMVMGYDKTKGIRVSGSEALVTQDNDYERRANVYDRAFENHFISQH